MHFTLIKRIHIILYLQVSLPLVVLGTTENGSEIESNDFKILIFTQHWPVSTCIQLKDDYANNTCRLSGLEDIWTVHGIWPSNFNSTFPAYCNDTWEFNQTQIRPLENQLETYWRNIQANSPMDTLWRHEWDKHGTCATVIPQLNTENKYFMQGLDWLKKYQMSTALSAAGIDPGVNKSYNATSIWKAVRDYMGKDPILECYTDWKTHEVYLFELRICFSKDLQFIDCDPSRTNGTSIGAPIIYNCPHNKLIKYPSRASLEQPVESKSYSKHWLVSTLEFIRWLHWATL